ncbi:hypothetical protein [Actinotalea sp.]|uniref:hypothetical protein n=1 Tax=Actinotalea sp. TaxID=1872145 RepID=UPI003562A302
MIPEPLPGPGPDEARPDGPVAVPVATTRDLVDGATEQWRAALVTRSGASALSDVARLGEAQLDLSAAHPSGIAQLFAGRPTRLSNLVREGSALVQAKRRARAVGAQAEDHAVRFGLASAFLAIGIASWVDDDDTDPGFDEDTVPSRTADAAVAADEEGAQPADPVRRMHGPVLLRPVSITARGRGEADYDLVLEPSLEINPLLAAALRRRGALLDPAALARGAFTASGFDPRPAVDRLGALGAAVLDGFELVDRVVIGTFVHPEQVLVDDLDALAPVLREHEVVAAVAGDHRAAEALTRPLPAQLTGDRPLDQERGVGDLDPAQAHVLDVIAAGHHLLLDAPAGADVAGTLAAVVADAAASGRTVLYVAGHRRAAEALTGRLDELGLSELVLDVAPGSGWRAEAGQRLLGAMTGDSFRVDAEKIGIVQRELLDRRERLHRYVDALHARREPWECSAHDALQALAKLTAARPAPRTTVRLPVAVAASLTAERRAQAAADLVTVAGLGAFTESTATTSWFGAEILTPERAHAAVERVARLLESIPLLQRQTAEVAEATGLTRSETPAQWAEQLEMLAGVRGALDIFQPIVFERSAADLVAATATPAWRAEHGIDMPGRVRRRLRRQAKDMVRPGRPVADLHTALVEVQAQREVWRAHCPAGGWPRIPEGLARIEQSFAVVRADLEALSEALATTAAGGDLVRLSWTQLLDRLRRLRLEQAALVALPERTALLRDLRKRGLGALLDDLTARRVPAGLVAVELELSWWSAVFEEILRQDPGMAGYDGAALARLTAEFRALDRRYLADRASVYRASSREAVRLRLLESSVHTEALFGEIVEDRFTSLRHAVERYPDVARHLRPCLVVGPMLVPHVLPPTRTEDLVILDATAHLPMETVVGAIARGRQVLVVGDTRCASGTALAQLTEVLPVVGLQVAASRRDPHLTAFLATHGYAKHVTATPLPTAESLLRLDVVDGTGMPGPSGTVEATRAEVDHVVDLVVEHALARPEESLAVVSVSTLHADRVREAVLAQVRDNPALEEFFSAERPEPFVVADVTGAEGLSRDAVILTVGFGRTPHGRVLHRFGALGAEGGRARLLQTLGATRHRLTVVSCFTADDLDEHRLTVPGPRLLADLLRLLGSPRPREQGGRPSPESYSGHDRLILDLAERLWRTGLVVQLDHGVDGGPRIPLVVGHPDVPGEMLVAVLTDDEAYVGEPSVRVRDRQVAERLEALGWTVIHIWSTAAFLDPQGEADAVCAAVLEASAERLRRRPVEVVQAPARLEDEEDGPDLADGLPVPEVDGTSAAPVPGSATTVASDGGQEVGDPVGDPAVVRHDHAAVELATAPEGRVLRRPDVRPGLPIGAYSDDELDDLVAWLRGDGSDKDDEALVEALRAELGLRRRGSRIDATLTAAVRRSR